MKNGSAKTAGLNSSQHMVPMAAMETRMPRMIMVAAPCKRLNGCACHHLHGANRDIARTCPRPRDGMTVPFARLLSAIVGGQRSCATRAESIDRDTQLAG